MDMHQRAFSYLLRVSLTFCYVPKIAVWNLSVQPNENSGRAVVTSESLGCFDSNLFVRVLSTVSWGGNSQAGLLLQSSCSMLFHTPDEVEHPLSLSRQLTIRDEEEIIQSIVKHRSKQMFEFPQFQTRGSWLVPSVELLLFSWPSCLIKEDILRLCWIVHKAILSPYFFVSKHEQFYPMASFVWHCHQTSSWYIPQIMQFYQCAANWAFISLLFPFWRAMIPVIVVAESHVSSQFRPNDKRRDIAKKFRPKAKLLGAHCPRKGTLFPPSTKLYWTVRIPSCCQNQRNWFPKPLPHKTISCLWILHTQEQKSCYEKKDFRVFVSFFGLWSFSFGVHSHQSFLGRKTRDVQLYVLLWSWWCWCSFVSTASWTRRSNRIEN